MSSAATVYDGVVRHARTEPIANRFRYRTRLWLVDLDDLPVAPRGLRWAARFEAGDHVGDPDRSIRSNIDDVLRAHDVDPNGCRILMLASPRGLGHAFNPISVHWVIDPAGGTRAVVAEVHNTYGGRHAYVLHPDASGCAYVAKALYVSPFYRVDGHYRIRVSPPEHRISLSVTFQPENGSPFIATLDGTRREPGPVARAALRTAGSALRTSALIRWQGVRLWARGLRVQRRPAGHDGDIMSRPAARRTREVAR